MLPCAECGHVAATRPEANQHQHQHEESSEDDAVFEEANDIYDDVNELPTTFLDIVEGESSTMEELDALYDFLPMTLEEIRVLRDYWYNAKFNIFK